MYLNLKALYEAEGIELEPSAAAGYGGLRLLLDSAEGQEYIDKNISGSAMDNATHIIWTTGGSFVPEEMHKAFREYAASL
jgi:D-serine dehydratase